MMWAWIVAGCVAVVAIAYWAIRQRKKRKKEEEDMAFGLRVWNAQGQVTLDNVDNVGRLFATVTIPRLNNTSPVVVPVPGLIPGRCAYVFSRPAHSCFVLTMQAGQVTARLTYASPAMGSFQVSMKIHLIFIR